jgi:Reverse transcriptase (RNA-dependent DNA polymerase)
MNWLGVLDIHRALANVHTDILGDWYRDPWGWPELRFVAQKAPELLVGRLNEAGAKRVLSLEVPKENFVIRPAVVLDPLDRLCYQALVDTLGKSLIGDLRGWAYGWRLPRKDPNAGVYASNSSEWEHYRQRLRFLALNGSFALTTDIVSFFASVPIHKLMEDARATAGSGAIVGRLENYLLGLQSVPARSGLPQRCWASSVLAHFFLSPIDDLLHARAPESHLFPQPSPAVVRWMDDIWVFADKSITLRLLQLELQDLLSRRGLRMNAGKTDVLHGDGLIHQVMELEHSAVDTALARPNSDPGPLNEMVQALLMEPEVASRTSLRFAATRIRKYRAFHLVAGFLDSALRIPHAADHLARLFRDSGDWKSLQQWYIGIVREFGKSLTWSTYHLGTMFPSREHPGDEFVRFWAEQLSQGDLPPLHLPLAAQRLAAWNANVARSAIQSAVRQPAYDHPFAIRALAIAGRAAGIPAAEARQWLRQFLETEVTLRYLDGNRMRAPRPTADFAGP